MAFALIAVLLGLALAVGFTDPEPEPDDDLPGGATEGDDSLTGSAGDDLIDGLGGNDTIGGGGGDDTLQGGAGDDWLTGGDGDDWLEGGEGRDTLISGSGDDTLLGGAGYDDFHLSRGFGDGLIDGGEDLGRLIIVGRQDVVLTLQTATSGTVEGENGTVDFENIASYSLGTGNHLVDASALDEGVSVFLDQTEDRLGDSTVIGGSGNDALTGGRRVDGGLGDDSLRGSYDATLIGGEGDDILWNRSFGDEAEDSLLEGGEGEDYLYALGAATLDGGEGDDTLYGGYGATMTGGEGADTFRVETYVTGDNVPPAGEAVTVTDYDSGEDRLVIELFYPPEDPDSYTPPPEYTVEAITDPDTGDVAVTVNGAVVMNLQAPVDFDLSQVQIVTTTTH